MVGSRKGTPYVRACSAETSRTPERDQTARIQACSVETKYQRQVLAISGYKCEVAANEALQLQVEIRNAKNSPISCARPHVTATTAVRSALLASRDEIQVAGKETDLREEPNCD